VDITRDEHVDESWSGGRKRAEWKSRLSRKAWQSQAADEGELVRASPLAEHNKPLNVQAFLQKMISTQPNNPRNR